MAFCVYAAPQSRLEQRSGAFAIVSPRKSLRQPSLSASRLGRNIRDTALGVGSPTGPALMGPGFAAPECEIIGIGHLPVGRLLRLDDLVGNTLALAIGNRLFLGVEVKGELLLHVGGRGPAHQRLDRAGLFRFVVEPPLPGDGPARLHRVFGGLKNARGYGWEDSLGKGKKEVRRKHPR